jgi:hypothetical protein
LYANAGRAADNDFDMVEQRLDDSDNFRPAFTLRHQVVDLKIIGHLEKFAFPTRVQ